MADAVAPGLAEPGVFLPYSPLHHLLLTDLAMPPAGDERQPDRRADRDRRRPRGGGTRPVRRRRPHPRPAQLVPLLGIGDRAITGPHLGGLSDVDTYTAFEESVAALSRLHAVDPKVVLHGRFGMAPLPGGEAAVLLEAARTFAVLKAMPDVLAAQLGP